MSTVKVNEIQDRTTSFSSTTAHNKTVKDANPKP